MSRTDSEAKERARRRKGRMVALVIAGAGLAAILAPYLVARAGLPFRFEFLIYLAAMAAFVWALVLSLQLWRDKDGR
ncbi:MAG: DUF5337 family protein [Paracoccaceae bacterium]|nr:DUF5337 family protein [Paracoccaceae bacterium]